MPQVCYLPVMLTLASCLRGGGGHLPGLDAHGANQIGLLPGSCDTGSRSCQTKNLESRVQDLQVDRISAIQR